MTASAPFTRLTPYEVMAFMASSMTTFAIVTCLPPETVMPEIVPLPPPPLNRAMRTPSSVVGACTVAGKVRPAAARGAIVTVRLGRPIAPNGQRDHVLALVVAGARRRRWPS